MRLWDLLEHYLAAEQPKMMRYRIRLLAIGDSDRLPISVRRTLEQVIELTRRNKRMTVILALSYSGRDEIVRMVKKLACEVQEGKCDPEEIDEGNGDLRSHGYAGCARSGPLDSDQRRVADQ